MSEINLDESMSEILDNLELDDEPDTDVDEPEAEEKAAEAEPEKADATDEPEPVDPPVDEKPAKAEKATAKAADEPLEPRLNLPPTTWTAEAKAQYKDLPAWAKKEVHKREEDVLRGITNLKEQSQFGDRITKAIEPYRAMLNAKGAQPDQAIGSLLNTFYLLETSTPQKRAMLMKDLMGRYETDMSLLTKEADPQQEAFYRAITPLQQQIQYLQSQLQGQTQRSEQQQLQEAQREIEQFVTEVDEKGQAKYPYFSNVSQVMSDLIEAGRATTLTDAYDMAVWADPSIRALLQSEQAQQQELKRQEEARKRAASAKKANSLNLGKSGSYETRQSKPTGSLAETMNEVFDAVASK